MTPLRISQLNMAVMWDQTWERNVRVSLHDETILYYRRRERKKKCQRHQRTSRLCRDRCSFDATAMCL